MLLFKARGSSSFYVCITDRGVSMVTLERGVDLMLIQLRKKGYPLGAPLN